MTRTIEAKHPALCSDCSRFIHVGDLITRDAVDKRWIHADCPVEEFRPVCPDCFTEQALNGKCMCP